jgi:hypothetical protein
MKFVLVACIFGAVLETIVSQGPVVEIQKHFEFEDALTNTQQDMWVWRSEASGLKTLRLEDEYGQARVELTLCITPYNRTLNQNVTLYLDDLRYSNDGPSDLVQLRFNNINFANFTTFEKWRSGHEWNVFRNSGNLGPAINLREGRYNLTISVVTDRWGIEFDRIRMNAENQDPTENLFCGASVYFVQ